MLLLSLLSPASGCEDPLEIRSIYPNEGSEDVPLNARMLVSFIGMGAADEYRVLLTQDDVQIDTTQTSWCYEHEGPGEVHCWIRVVVKEELEASTRYRLTVSTTDKWPHSGARSTQSSFTTGTETIAPVEGTPGLVVLEAWMEKDKECGYDIARRYWLAPSLQLADDDTGAAVFHLFALDEDGAPGDIIHTIFSGPPGAKKGGGEAGRKADKQQEPPGLKQYLDGSTLQTDCFRIIEEDGAGNLTPHADACFGDSGGSDSGDSDSGGSDSGGSDSPDSGSDSDGSDSGTGSTGSDSGVVRDDPPMEDGCSCSGGQGWVALLLPLILLRRRSRGTV